MFDTINPYFKRVQLLVRVLPHVAACDCFALKGGTAINLFVRDMPRLSVDIDLVYTPIKERVVSLFEITQAFQSMAAQIKHSIVGSSVSAQKNNDENIAKLVVWHDSESIKIEASPVSRGLLYSPTKMQISRIVENFFGYVKVPVVSFDELYAGKLCAALDRQHPRDFFDVMVLFANEGITKTLKKSFLVYLICGNRPISELLMPNRKDLTEVFKTQFEKMPTIPVQLSDLIETREKLFRTVLENLTNDDKKFLISFKQGNPDWGLLGLDDASKLPAVQWKLYNLNQMSAFLRKAAVEKLEKILYR
ncbi:MAG: nucleotidyl transferase AbiEii/AbiGii toxin family protein [Candidatus Omnitrophota bacterium]|nr:nucleotidyl transferase AbiEii/AbiGii toxin family protein [Candidatus Omnitrophota bacterium]